jgi:methylglyoxal synthase
VRERAPRERDVKAAFRLKVVDEPPLATQQATILEATDAPSYRSVV